MKMTTEKLQKKLIKVQNKYSRFEQVWKVLPDFRNYQVSNLGNVRSKGFYIRKPIPRKTEQYGIYFSKPGLLTPLRTGFNGRWTSYRIVPKQGEWKQLSIQKLMISAFLKISINELPKYVFKINKDQHFNNTIYNVSFYRSQYKRG